MLDDLIRSRGGARGRRDDEIRDRDPMLPNRRLRVLEVGGARHHLRRDGHGIEASPFLQDLPVVNKDRLLYRTSRSMMARVAMKPSSRRGQEVDQPDREAGEPPELRPQVTG